MPNYDAIIIGTGQAGPSLARRLAQAGQKVAVIERKLFGGTCVNTGCTPTKTMVASAYAAHLARRGAEFGVEIAGGIKVDMAKVKARKDGVVALSTTGVERHLRSEPNCTVYQGHGRFVSPREVQVGSEVLGAEKIFINVGGRASRPPITGLDQVPFLTNSSMMAVGFPAGASGHRRRQLYRPRIRPDVSPLREQGHHRRDDAAAGPARGRGCLRRHRRDHDQGGHRASPQRHLHPSLAPRSGNRRRRRLRRGAARGRGHASADGGGTAAEHRRSRPRQGRGGDGPARLYPGGRRAAYQCARHLGAGRLQRQGRLHPYLLQRFRDRGGQSAGRRASPGERPPARLCPLYRSAAGPRRHDRDGDPQDAAGRR